MSKSILFVLLVALAAITVTKTPPHFYNSLTFYRILLLQVCHGSVIRREDPNAILIADDDVAVVLPFQDTKNDAVLNTDLQTDNQVKKERGCVILCIIGK